MCTQRLCLSQDRDQYLKFSKALLIRNFTRNDIFYNKYHVSGYTDYEAEIMISDLLLMWNIMEHMESCFLRSVVGHIHK